MTTELQYPIRGERFRGVNDEYYYIQEYHGIRLGDTVETIPFKREGKLITLVHIVNQRPPDCFIGIVRMPDRVGSNGYATEHGHMLGISDYDRNTHGYNFDNIKMVYNGPCRECISVCKGEERCAFYREEI